MDQRLARRQVGIDQPGEIGRLDLGEGAAVPLADIVDEDVDVPGGRQFGGHGRPIGHFEDQRLGLVTGGAQFGEPRRELGVRSAMQQQAGAGFGKALGHLPAEAAGRAGHQGGAAIETELVRKKGHGTRQAGLVGLFDGRVSFGWGHAATA